MTPFRLSLVLISLVLIEAALIGQAMTVPFNHDEHGYLVSGVLSTQYRLYSEFGYNHMPYLPMGFGTLWRWVGFDQLVTVGRWLIAAFAALSGLLIFWMARQVSRSEVVAIASTAMFALNGFVLFSVGKAAKDFPAMALALLGLALLLYGLSGRQARRWPLFASGVALALAVGFKLTYVVFLAPLALALLVRGHGRQMLWAHAAGLLLGIAPLALLLMGDPAAFMFNNVGYHQLNTAWRSATGYPLAMDLPGKLAYVAQHLGRDPAWSGVILATLACAGAARWARTGSGVEGVAIAGMTGASLVASLAPTPSFPHHFTAAVPYMILSLAAGVGLQQGRLRTAGIALVCFLVGIHLVQHGPTAVQALASLPQPTAWTGHRFHQEALAVRRSVGPWKPGDRMVTLAPALSLEAGLPIDREFATGPFFFRVADQVPAALRPRFHLVAPSTVDAWLAAAPPRAILVGFESGWPAMGEPSLDAPLIRFAERKGYRRVEVPGSRAVVYLRPEAALIP